MDSHATLIEEIRMLRESNKALAEACRNLLRELDYLVDDGTLKRALVDDSANVKAVRAALAKAGIK